MVNGARLLGPAMAGIIIAAVGEGYCFLIDGLSYFAVIASLLAMKIEGPAVIRSAASMWVQLKEGWTYVRTFAPIRTVLSLFAFISFIGVPYTVLMPVFATKILHGGSHTLGFLMGAAGVGSIIRGAQPGRAQIRAGTLQGNPNSSGALRLRVDRFFLFAKLLAVTRGVECDGVWDDAIFRRQQHGNPNHCRR